MREYMWYTPLARKLLFRVNINDTQRLVCLSRPLPALGGRRSQGGIAASAQADYERGVRP
jgi:hypothetical protein